MMKNNNRAAPCIRIALSIALAASSAFSASAFVSAETVRIPVGQGSEAWNGKVPSRGISKSQVEAKFGSPTSKTGPNGQPPIYFWEYPDFTVYFEYDHVIHTVIKNRKG